MLPASPPLGNMLVPARRLRWPSGAVVAIFDATMLEITVPPAASGHRLDRFLADALAHLSRSRVQALIRDGHVLLNQRPAGKPSESLRAADIVSWEEPPVVDTAVVAETLDLSILHEDDDLIVLDKAAGMVTHPAPGHDAGTLVNALLAHCPTLSGIGGERRPGIVHRLDKDTSGCLVVAKNDLAHRALSAQFADRSTVKRYLALVRGVPRPSVGTIDKPVGRHPVHRKRMAVVAPPHGREARTDYRVRRELPAIGASLVECRLHSGRTHQIRVHMKHLGYPILGDTLYGGPGSAPRPMLHAWTLGFLHPRTGLPMEFRAPVPADFLAYGFDPVEP